MNYVREDDLGSVIKREIGMYHGYCLHLIEALIDSNMIDNQQRHAPFSSTVTMRLRIQLESLRAAGSRRLRPLGDASISRRTLASAYRSSSTRCLPWSRSSAWWHRAPSRRGSASRLRSAHSAGHCGRALWPCRRWPSASSQSAGTSMQRRTARTGPAPSWPGLLASGEGSCVSTPRNPPFVPTVAFLLLTCKFRSVRGV